MGSALAAGALFLSGGPASSAVGDPATATLTAATIQRFDFGVTRFATALPDESCVGVELDDRASGDSYRVEFPASCFEDFLVDYELDGFGYGFLPDPIDVLLDVSVAGDGVRLPSELTDRSISTEQFGSAGSGEAYLFRSADSGCSTVVVEVVPDGASSTDLTINCDGSTPSTGVRPNFDNWHLGDVHVHAAGDTALDRNKVCRDNTRIVDDDGSAAEKELCAEFLMDLTYKAASANDVEWFILAEHGTWLGMEFGDAREIHVPLPGGSITFNQAAEDAFTGQWDIDEAQNQFELLSEESSENAPRYGIRGLMGQELGTAFVCDRGPGLTGRGHFSTYYASEIVENYPFPSTDIELGFEFAFPPVSVSVADSNACDEIAYVQNVTEAGGWGAVNHPNAGAHSWDCWELSSPDCRTDFDLSLIHI